ncbi:MAG: hypothetical protein LBM25_02230 [Bacteroidales bacterium]|jgi:hypothetical protein|nr:hypothetical protein [Bacteroidales bacterium]
MKKILLLLILTGCCFTTSNAQVEKFFSFEVSANTKNFFSEVNTSGDPYLFSSADKSNYEVSFLPAFNIGRFKFNVGISYYDLKYYEMFQDMDYVDGSNLLYYYQINYINIPININFNIYKSDRIWFNCFLGGIIGIFNNGTKDFYSEKGMHLRYKYTGYYFVRNPDFSLRLGVEFSLITLKNLKINIAPFASYYVDGNALMYYHPVKLNKLITRKLTASPERVGFSSNPLSLGISVGLEYMFRFGKKN